MDALMVGTKCLKFQVLITFKGCRDGAVMRALASQRYGPGSTPRSDVICWLSFWFSTLHREVFSRYSDFSSPQKPAFDFVNC